MYFDPVNSAKRNYGNQTELILKTLIQRFVGANPEVPYSPVLDFPELDPYDERGWCHVLKDRFSTLPIGKKVLATSYWPAGNDRMGTLVFKCYGPTTIYVNDELIMSTNPGQENLRNEFSVHSKLHKGWNKLSVITEKTPLGLGFQLKSQSAQWDPVHFYGKEDPLLPVMGFTAKEYEGNLEAAPFLMEKEEVTSTKTATYLVKLAIPNNTSSFSYQGKGDLFFNDVQILRGTLVKAPRNTDWLDVVYSGVNLTQDMATISWSEAEMTNWLYCGPLAKEDEKSPDFSQLHRSPQGEVIYWQAPFKGGHLRLARNSALFAHWTYWMGVTLYGFLEASTYFDVPAWKDYSLASVSQIVNHDAYGVWDKQNYHYPLINTQFYWLKELDDCGSFGNLMLESAHYQENKNIPTIAKRIADFMENKVIRQADKAFYRGNDTMWVDDLYMSTPFLTRYWELSGDEKYLTEAIRQFQLFKKRFFMEDKKIMSHIFDTRFEKANRIPWSRGNGWVIFSLSELLNKLPENHPERANLVIFYNELIEGILAQQDENGLWHQILDDPAAYSESSCTAMFICALSRGIRNGYMDLEFIESSQVAVNNAWNGLVEYCIDKDGNLYGVCRGSGFSFSRDYYRGLSWLLNDAHGIGIVALAGVEYEKLNNLDQ